ncbi:helix-turn-helix transcriptional regulator [[Clostridium] colinum]|uniref:helix-turn-helix transcriptional regulator n=1 Tax=[Clostridium] colinum TaxID=36835 RepID=UPI002025AAD8|nr:helix-turn-helix transcriptional regulator [[Clostridium] colinum]
MVDTRKLKGLLIENGYTQADVAKKLGISLNSFSRKINNKTQFNLTEAFLLKNILKISDMEKVFFTS